MLYVLLNADGSDLYIVGVFNGPDGADVKQLQDTFFSQYNWRGLGKPNYPEYTGPVVPFVYPANSSGCIPVVPFVYPANSSGCIPAGMLMPVTTSIEYREWCKLRQQVEDEWNVRRKAKEATALAKYGGTTLHEAFLGYLRAEHGFTPVEFRAVYV